MDRKEFLNVCGGACLGILGLSLMTEGCSPAHYVQGTINGNRIQVPKSHFTIIKKDKTKYRHFVVVRTERSDFPIVLYRNSETAYTALLLKCTHQGNELTVNGDMLTCAAHGSEFSNKGEVLQGPAEQNIKPFPITTDDKNIYIQLA